MKSRFRASAAIVDYGMGNLYSVKSACENAGINAQITTSSKVIMNSDAVILPGVGAFGDAMANLKKMKLVETLHRVIQSGKPFLGICLGMQLLMSESEEFGRHRGLGVFKGKVVKFRKPACGTDALKVPQIGWNKIFPVAEKPWKDSPLEGVKEGAFLYFVHSYYVKPADKKLVLCVSEYGGENFCSGMRQDNVFAFQFHPEKSAAVGLLIYKNFGRLITAGRKGGG